jgi:hypothetical protein
LYAKTTYGETEEALFENVKGYLIGSHVQTEETSMKWKGTEAFQKPDENYTNT